MASRGGGEFEKCTRDEMNICNKVHVHVYIVENEQRDGPLDYRGTIVHVHTLYTCTSSVYMYVHVHA